MSIKGPFERSLDALGHQYRRQLLFELNERRPDEALTGYVPTLYRFESRRPAAGGVAAKRVDSDVDAADAIEPYHRHLPKLADYGYVSWERESGDVDRGPNWEEIEPLLTVLWRHREELPADWL